MNKKLINAVKRNLGGDANEQLKDIAKHGIAGGFGGFIYYRDTIKFFKNNRAEIIELVREMAQEFGQDPIEFVASFNCLKPADFETREEIARALYGKLKADDTQVPNALAWFAGEQVARYVTDGGQ
jgi:hypothetical protein